MTATANDETLTGSKPCAITTGKGQPGRQLPTLYSSPSSPRPMPQGRGCARAEKVENSDHDFEPLEAPESRLQVLSSAATTANVTIRTTFPPASRSSRSGAFNVTTSGLRMGLSSDIC
ncbi:unnamed protein product [Tilletia controversa]|nr:unnamed protein product [Tilletia controversa]